VFAVETTTTTVATTTTPDSTCTCKGREPSSCIHKNSSKAAVSRMCF